MAKFKIVNKNLYGVNYVDVYLKDSTTEKETPAFRFKIENVIEFSNYMVWAERDKPEGTNVPVLYTKGRIR